MADTSDVEPHGREGRRGGTFSQKVFGLPLWAWALIGVAVVGYVYYEKKKKATTTTSTAQTGANTATTPNTAEPLNVGLLQESQTTNAAWEANAIVVLSGEGYSQIQVQQALNQYLAGGVLSSVQQEIVNAAEVAVGPPPNPPTTPPPGSAAPVVPPAVPNPTGVGAVPIPGGGGATLTPTVEYAGTSPEAPTLSPTGVLTPAKLTAAQLQQFYQNNIAREKAGEGYFTSAGYVSPPPAVSVAAQASTPAPSTGTFQPL